MILANKHRHYVYQCLPTWLTDKIPRPLGQAYYNEHSRKDVKRSETLVLGSSCSGHVRRGWRGDSSFCTLGYVRGCGVVTREAIGLDCDGQLRNHGFNGDNLIDSGGRRDGAARRCDLGDGHLIRHGLSRC